MVDGDVMIASDGWVKHGLEEVFVLQRFHYHFAVSLPGKGKTTAAGEREGLRRRLDVSPLADGEGELRLQWIWAYRREHGLLPTSEEGIRGDSWGT